MPCCARAANRRLASESQGWLPSLKAGFRVSRLASESQERGPLLPGATPGSSAPRRLQLRGAELRGAERGAPLQLRSSEAPLLGTYRMSPVPSPSLLAEPWSLPPFERHARGRTEPLPTLRPDLAPLYGRKERERARVRDAELAEVWKILRRHKRHDTYTHTHTTTDTHNHTQTHTHTHTHTQSTWHSPTRSA